MSELPDPEPPAATQAPPPASSSGGQLLGVMKVLTSLAWIITAFIAIVEYANYSDIADGSGASAVQISQLVDQAIVGVMPFFVAAFALLAITIVIALPSRSD